MRFSEWIVSELEKKGWSRSEAARRGDISPSMFDKVINGSSKPGMKFIDGLAKAFKISRAEVMTHIENRPMGDEWVDEMTYKLEKLDPSRRKIAENLLEALLKEETETAISKTKTRPAGT